MAWEAPQIHILPDAAQLYDQARARLLAVARAAIAARGAFHLGLAGGSTPQGLYQALAAEPGALDWSRVHIYFGDERCVGPDHHDSNYRMARDTLLTKVPLPPSQVHRMVGEDPDPVAAAHRYQAQLRSRLPAGPDGVPQFDLILLGLGPDGHIASLFPDTAVLDNRHDLVAASYVERLGVWRISITYPLIERARHVFFLVSGAGKADILLEILGRGADHAPYPVERIRAEGEVEWFLDEAAAAKLRR